MNQQFSAPESAGPPEGPPAPAPVVDEAADALRLPGPLGRLREGLPVAQGAPLVPTALSAFNRLTGRLDQAAPERPEDAVDGVVAELNGAPAEPIRVALHDRRV